MKNDYDLQDAWAPLDEYPNYEINKEGQIREADTGMVLAHQSFFNGSRYVTIIGQDRKPQKVLVDLMVANAFIPKQYLNSNKVKHKDGKIHNCSVDNLAWIDDDSAEKDYYQAHSVVKPKEYFLFYPLMEFPDSIYEINKMGQVRNKVTHKLVNGAFKKGYKIYVLHINKKKYFRYAHIMVAKQFIPNPGNKPIVNHIDEDRSNPCIDNLEWVTASENSRHGTATARGNAGRNKMVNEYDINGKYMRTWKSKKALSDFINSLSADYNTSYVIAQILSYNFHNLEKTPFANRIFLFHTGNCDDITVQIHLKQFMKYNNINLDGIEVPCEYLVNIDSMNDRLSVLKRLLSSSITFTNMQKEAIAYAIKRVEIIEKESQ